MEVVGLHVIPLGRSPLVMMNPKSQVCIGFALSHGQMMSLVLPVPEPRVCTGLGALGARGVSIMFASGDFGAGNDASDPGTQKCFTSDSQNKTHLSPLPAHSGFMLHHLGVN